MRILRYLVVICIISIAVVICVISIGKFHAEQKFDPSKDYSVRIRRVKRVKASYSASINMPLLDVREWILIAPKPPSLTGGPMADH